MANSLSKWNELLTAILNIPSAKVNRSKFLDRELRLYCDESKLNEVIEGNKAPYDAINENLLDKIADQRIKKYTNQASGFSFVSGLPGGLAMLATLPADMVQYYYYSFKIAQELAYLYGFHDFCDKNGEITERSLNTLTILIGVMSGNAITATGLKIVSSQVLEEMSKVTFYQIAKSIAKELGMMITKRSFSKVIGTAIPILGGVVSGSITMLNFRPSAKRLKKRLQADLSSK